ncbi:OsmC family protein [Acuticoccus kandeliae]|uniref:OsmC family protein n=1 Tax=Acuticoccus kandeliae TaxID=2073160 RepID=UPI000D3EAA6D|nr:OsmC family protein [Acuticoccus kandeliae]
MLNRPIAFPVIRPERDAPSTLTLARSLEGMRKEAIVITPKSAWSLLSDEGPALGGDDLAPFPLGYFAGGLAASLLDALTRLNKGGIDLSGVELMVETPYHLEGSYAKGTIRGSAMAPSITVRAPEADRAALRMLLHDALFASPAFAFVRAALANRFALSRNGTRMAIPHSIPLDPRPSPLPHFDAAPLPGAAAAASVVEKVSGDLPYTVKGSGILDTVKRAVLVEAQARIAEKGIVEAVVRLTSPQGSRFRLRAELGGETRAPSPEAYVAAGLAFCFMTQLGRYAHTTKTSLTSAVLHQETRVKAAEPAKGTPAAADPVLTWAFLESGASDPEILQMLKAAERTCFLHALCAATLRPRLAIR